MRERKVTPELLDSLPAEAPAAIRSRRELRVVNALMGNERWVIRELLAREKIAGNGIVEIGAGEGSLCRKMHAHFSNNRICGIDLLERPASLPQAIDWHCGNVITLDPPRGFGVLVANLFLHHFTDEELGWFAAWLPHFSLVIINEPLRRQSAHVWGSFLRPFIGHVTRHDMHVSIDAGFLCGELPELFHEHAADWEIQEKEQWPGAQRGVWCRK